MPWVMVVVMDAGVNVYEVDVMSFAVCVAVSVAVSVAASVAVSDTVSVRVSMHGCCAVSKRCKRARWRPAIPCGLQCPMRKCAGHCRASCCRPNKRILKEV